MLTWIQNLIGGAVAKKTLGSLVRHLIGWLGGMLAVVVPLAQIDPALVTAWLNSTQDLLIALIPFAVSLALSMLGNSKK